jgi:metallo-beta-lactamase family protein
MQLQFWGAARTVTGSMHLLEVGGKRVLLDCGMYQGRKSFERNRDLPFDPASIDAVVLSHAHMDHSGNLPTLVRAGFKGRIYATAATRHLCAYMLLDSAKIQENDVLFINKHRARRGQRPYVPLYTRRDAMETLPLFVSVGYDKTFEAVPGIRATFRDAGHILGSAIVVLDLEEAGKKKRLVFSGDLGRDDAPILRDPETADGAALVIMESTYGNRVHEGRDQALENLQEAARKTYDEKGQLIIPAFAVGRTQEVVYRFNQLWEEGQLAPIDVYVDSPLAVNVTDIFRLHPECYDEEMQEAVLKESDHDPLGFRNLTYVRSIEASKRLNNLRDPAIIVSASGMCEGGRVMHHLRNHIDDPGTTILFVGYQAQGTLGRRLVDGAEQIEIHGKEVQVRAKIERAESYSAHADRNELLKWTGEVSAKGDLESVFLVHGEDESLDALAATVRDQGMAKKVQVPSRGETIEI